MLFLNTSVSSVWSGEIDDLLDLEEEQFEEVTEPVGYIKHQVNLVLNRDGAYVLRYLLSFLCSPFAHVHSTSIQTRSEREE